MKRNRAVLQIIGTLAPGGAEVRMLELIQNLKNQEIKFIILQTNKVPGVLTKEFEDAGALVINAPMKSFRFHREFFKACVINRVQVFQCGVSPGSMRIALWMLVASLLGVPERSVRFHSDGLGKSLSRFQRISDRLFRLFINWTATSITGVSPSALTLAWRSDWQKDPRCRVLIAGVDLNRFEMFVDHQDYRSKLGISEKAEIILHVGRATPGKNRDFAIKTLADIPPGSSGRPHLVFVGSESKMERSRLSDSARTYGLEGFVHFLGHRGDVASLMKIADMLMFTSKFEGLPGVVFEARAAGLPVVSSKLPGTEYLASKLSGIVLLDLAQQSSVWGKEIRGVLEAYRPTIESRDEILNYMRGSEFDLSYASNCYLEVWRFNKI